MEPRNRPTVPADPANGAQALLKEFAESNPDFAKDLISDDFEALIVKMRGLQARLASCRQASHYGVRDNSKRKRPC